MKYGLCVVFFLVLPASATISYVRSSAQWSGGTGSCTVGPAPTNTGDLIVAWGEWQTSGPNTVTATAGQTQTGKTILSAVGPTVQSASNTAVQIFYVADINNTGETVTLTFGGTGTVTSSACVIVEYSGADLTYPLDSVSGGFSTSGNQTTLLDSGTVAPANANLLVFGAGEADQNVPMTPGSGFTSLQASYGSWGTGMVEDNTAAISGNNVLQRATACLGTSICPPGSTLGNWVMQMAVFRDASWTVGGGWSPPRFAQILDASQFPGSDIGAQINNAYAALPATGGHIIIPAKADGSCYNFSTPIVFATAGKYVLLEFAGAAGTTSAAAPVMQGCLNFIPTTGTAITLNYVAPNPTPTSAHGLRNISLVDNQCLSTTCVGGTAYGIDFGNTTLGGSGNYGALGATMENVSIAGFETAIRNINFYSDPITWINPQIWCNGVGFDVGNVSTETFLGGYFNSNVDAVQADNSTSTSELHFVGTSFVANQVVFSYNNVTNYAAYLFLDHVHLENGESYSSPTHFLVGNVNTYISGGSAEDDSGTHGGNCSNADWWFNPKGSSSSFASSFIIDGMTFNTAACNPTNGVVYATGNTRISVSAFNASGFTGATPLNIVGGTNAVNATLRMYNGNINNAPSVWTYESPQRTTPRPLASWPSCAPGIEGATAPITDSTTAVWGSSIGGTGTNHVLGYCDGTTWTVAGK